MVRWCLGAQKRLPMPSTRQMNRLYFARKLFSQKYDGTKQSIWCALCFLVIRSVSRTLRGEVNIVSRARAFPRERIFLGSHYENMSRSSLSQFAADESLRPWAASSSSPTQALDGEIIDFSGFCFPFLGASCAIEIPHVTLTHFYSSLSCARTEMKKNNSRWKWLMRLLSVIHTLSFQLRIEFITN